MLPAHSFVENSFAVAVLDHDVDPRLQRLVVRLRQHQVFFLTGAGLSAGSPTDLPTGPRVAEHLRDWAVGEGLGTRLAALAAPLDLGEVAEVLEDAVGRDAVVKYLLKAVPWTRQPFNLGHLVLALLFAEGWLETSFTANWDSCTRCAGESIAGLDLACPCDIPSLRVASSPRYVHLHGQAESPGTLVIKKKDLDEPSAMKWSQPQIAGAIATSEAVVVGFGTEPAYVLRTLEDMLRTMGTSPAAVIDLETENDFVAVSPRLASALGVGSPGSRYVEGRATESLGEVARGCYAAAAREVLVEAERRAKELAAKPLVLRPSVIEQVRSLLMDRPLADLLDWLWRAAQLADDDVALQPTLRKTAADLEAVLAGLMLLGSCTDVTAVAAVHGGVRLTRHGGDVDVWAVVPEKRVSVTTAVRRAVGASARFTRPGGTGRPLVLFCAGTDGAVPGGGHAKLLGSSAAGALTKATRPAAAVTTLDEVHRRLCTLAARTTSPLLSDLLPLP
ncbi:MAG: hypothetical protein QOH12_2953 [Solirubrobacteraceae bacterium]|jgi:hypothetical protein|nr:hypothetical protein [Solirubrobacteraceae bacterium]